MFALLIPFLASHSELPAAAIKWLLIGLVVLVVLLSVLITVHGIKSYLANERAVAVELARKEAAAEISSKVNAATAEAEKAQAVQQAASMRILEGKQVADDAVWSGFEKQVDDLDLTENTPRTGIYVDSKFAKDIHIEGNTIVDSDPTAITSYDGPKILNSLPASEVLAPTSHATPATKKVAPHVQSKTVSDFIRADADANRLLERAAAAAAGH